MIRVIHGITEDYAAENTAERLQMKQQVTLGGMKTVGRNLAWMSSWLMRRDEDLYLIMGAPPAVGGVGDDQAAPIPPPPPPNASSLLLPPLLL